MSSIPELVGVITPGAAPDDPAGRGLVRAPFPDIARHIKSSVGREARKASHGDRALDPEIAEGGQERVASELKNPVPRLFLASGRPPMDEVGRLFLAYSAKAAASYQLTPETG